MTKAADDIRLREIGKQFAAEDLALHLETLGADASVFLRPAEDRAARWGSAPPVYIPAAIADMIAAALLAVPRKRTGRRRLWLDRVYYAALLDLAAGKEVNVVAREIAKATGQAEGSCRHRLQELKAEGRVEEIAALKGGYTADDLTAGVRERLAEILEERVAAWAREERPGAK
jgi:Winged helix-turn-helix transcription repressor, HrcA DNA-binding